MKTTNLLLTTCEEILAHFNNGEEIPAYKFLQLEIAIQNEKINNERTI